MAKRVAIVGSGISGIGALWALNTSTDHEVHLFEASSRLGGHTNTVPFEGPNGDEIEVDTGFAIMNTATYPNFTAFLRHLGIPTRQIEMTFSVSRDQGTFEWAAPSARSIFAQPKNIFNPRMWRMLFEIIRFKEFALDLLQSETETESGPMPQASSKGNPDTPAPGSIGEYLDKENYAQEFRDNYLLPTIAAFWRTSPDKCLKFPAITVIRFMYDHHLLNLVAKSSGWMSIPGGAKRYINAVLEDFPRSRTHIK